MQPPSVSRFPERHLPRFELLDTGFQHFGLWPRGAPDWSMEEAQRETIRRIGSWLPPPPARVLLIGPAAQLSRQLLVSLGHDVRALEVTKSTGLGQARRLVEESRTEAAASDAVVLLESAGRLGALEETLSEARSLLRDKGTLILLETVAVGSSESELPGPLHPSEIVIRLSEAGFCITREEDLTAEVTPTCERVVETLSRRREEIRSRGRGDDPQIRDLDESLAAWTRLREDLARGRLGYRAWVARKEPFFIRAYRPGDEAQILDLFRRTFHLERRLDHWQWLYRDNPYGAFRVSGAFDAQGQLVAQYAGYPVPFYRNLAGEPETFLGLQIGDTMTAPEVRHVGRGKTSLLGRLVQHYYASFCQGQVAFNYGFNTGNIHRFSLLFVGAKVTEPVPFWSKPLAPGESRGRRPFWRRLLPAFQVERVEALTPEWDELFQRVAPAYRFLIRRDTRYVDWRYRACPHLDYWIFAVRRRGRLVGWGVFRRVEGRIVWGDALFEPRGPGAVRALLQTVVSSPIGQDAGSIEGWFSPRPRWWKSILEELGFQRRPEPQNLIGVYVPFTEPDPGEDLQNDLYLTKGDSDLF